MSRKILRALTLPVFMLLCAGAHAESALEQLSKPLMLKCPERITKLVERSDLEPVLKTRSVNVDAVCACADQHLLADSRLADYLNVNKLQLVARLMSPQLQAYAKARITQALFVCLAPELDASLTATPLD